MFLNNSRTAVCNRPEKCKKSHTGKLYDSEGKRVKNVFKKMRKAYPDDPIDWDKEWPMPPI